MPVGREAPNIASETGDAAAIGTNVLVYLVFQSLSSPARTNAGRSTPRRTL
jgi:hypothetical protein